jgi:HK97 family phage portal protein
MEFTSLNLPNPPGFTGFRNSGSSTMAAPSSDLVQALLGFPASAGKPVTRATAIRVAAVLSSVKVLANDIAKMPLILRETKEVGGRQRTQAAIKDPLYSILKDIPNRWQTSYQLRWFLASQLIMKGACYCQKITDQKGDVVELVPLNAWSMDIKWDFTGGPNPQRDQKTGKAVPVLCWHYMDGHAEAQKFYQDDLWHVTSHNLEGIGVEGASLIALGKEAISVLIAAEETAGRNFANGLGMGGFISFPAENGPDESQAQNIVDRLKKDFSGSQNAGKFSIIPMGGKWEKMTFNAQESQLLESRKWNEETVARMFGGAPLVVKLGLGQQNSTYASSSAFLDEYFNTSLLPYTTAIEQSITRDLIDKADRGTKYAKHNADIILRGSPDERAKTNAALIASGQLTPNEARAIEDRDYIEGGDILVLAANSCVFDIEEQEWFIPGQKPPESAGTDDDAPSGATDSEPDAQGGSDDDDDTEPQPQPNKAAPTKKVPPKPNKAKARLDVIANSLAERIMRKESKGGIDAKFVAEVMNVSKDEAEAYIAARGKLNDQEARAALVALATQGE